MPRLFGAIERSFGLYRSSRHARQGQHHLDCSLISLSGIAQALTNVCWPRCSGRFQIHSILIGDKKTQLFRGINSDYF